MNCWTYWSTIYQSSLDYDGTEMNSAVLLTVVQRFWRRVSWCYCFAFCNTLSLGLCKVHSEQNLTWANICKYKVITGFPCFQKTWKLPNLNVQQKRQKLDLCRVKSSKSRRNGLETRLLLCQRNRIQSLRRATDVGHRTSTHFLFVSKPARLNKSSANLVRCTSRSHSPRGSIFVYLLRFHCQHSQRKPVQRQVELEVGL